MDKMWKYIIGGGTFLGVVALMVGLVLTGGVSGNIAGDDQSQTPDNQSGEEMPTEVKWQGRSVNELVHVTDNNDNNVNNSFVYEFDEKPDNWKDQETISNDLGDAQANRSTDGNGEVTVSGDAGTTDYLVVHKSGTYYEFKKVTYETGNSIDEPLGDYNSAPQMTEVSGLTDYYSMSTQTIDLGVSSNESSRDLQGEIDIEPSTDTEVRLQKAVVSEGNHPPQENNDNTGALDEGTESITVTIVSSSDSKEATILTDSGIDELSKGDNPSDGEFEITLGDRVFNDEQGGSVKVDYTGATDTVETAADDEQLGDGEDILGVQIIDDLGQSPGVNSVTG